jgi:hypothetical protein
MYLNNSGGCSENDTPQKNPNGGCTRNIGQTPTGDMSLLSNPRPEKKYSKHYKISRVASIGIKKHIKIKSVATSYSPDFAKYF